MPEAPIPCEPAGLGPDGNLPGDMNIQSQINPLASADAGGTAGHDAAACVSARGKCDGASVCDARDARMLSPTTLPFQARQVVAPQAQNFGTGAAVIELAINPTIESAGSNTSAAFTINPTIESAGIDTPAASISKDSTKGKITAFFVKSAAHGRARRSAVRGPSDSLPFPSVSIPVPTPAGVAPFDAVAPSVPSVSIPVPTPADVAPFDAVAPSIPSVSIPVPTPAGVAPFDAVAPVRPSVPPPDLSSTFQDANIDKFAPSTTFCDWWLNFGASAEADFLNNQYFGDASTNPHASSPDLSSATFENLSIDKLARSATFENSSIDKLARSATFENSSIDKLARFATFENSSIDKLARSATFENSSLDKIAFSATFENSSIGIDKLARSATFENSSIDKLAFSATFEEPSTNLLASSPDLSSTADLSADLPADLSADVSADVSAVPSAGVTPHNAVASARAANRSCGDQSPVSPPIRPPTTLPDSKSGDAPVDRFFATGNKPLIAAAGTKALPVQTNNSNPITTPPRPNAAAAAASAAAASAAPRPFVYPDYPNPAAAAATASAAPRPFVYPDYPNPAAAAATAAAAPRPFVYPDYPNPAAAALLLLHPIFSFTPTTPAPLFSTKPHFRNTFVVRNATLQQSPMLKRIFFPQDSSNPTRRTPRCIAGAR